MQKIIDKAAVLVEAMPYIRRFHDAMVLVKFGGSVMEDAGPADSALRDLVFMSLVGMRPLVVHGGGHEITKALTAAGIETRFIDGLRYTCAETIKVVDKLMHDDINPRLVSGINSHGGKGHALSGKSILKCRRYQPLDKAGQPLDLGFVGEITDVDTDALHKILETDAVPVITPLGVDDAGTVYNINADTCACKIAEALLPRKLVFISDVPGLLRHAGDDTSLISSASVDDIEELIADGVISGGMIPKVRSMVHALEVGVRKVHLVDGRLQHSLLLELFTDEGVGTEIVKEVPAP